jgi:hypothetical protein
MFPGAVRIVRRAVITARQTSSFAGDDEEETEWDFEYRVREAQRDELEEEEAVAFARYVDGVSISMRVLGKKKSCAHLSSRQMNGTLSTV